MSFPHAGASGLRVGAHSQPRTPTSGHLAMIHQNVHSAPGEVMVVVVAVFVAFYIRMDDDLADTITCLSTTS